jgi:hypothetical protein
MGELAAGTGWRIRRFLDRSVEMYLAILEKETQPCP